ncbi:transcription factor S [Candidatus Woesearchaeota archaeon]|jgi:DNA-directed RNA polymerase subunit M|nr:transcription factor S [Candidatus Woesearchaeota archaeon]
MFCPKCGRILMPKKEEGKRILACSCGYKDKKPEKIEIKEVVSEKKKEIEVVEKEVETLPLIEAECPKCGHDKARYWLQQTRAADEPETKFLKCEKCKHTWRDYS